MLYSGVCKDNICGYPERRWMQFLILRTIYEKPSYGYEIIKKIEEISEGRHKIESGTMYTILRRMEQNEVVTSSWKKSKGGPDKRTYKVTKKGEKYLKAWLEMIIERKTMIDKMATFYDKHFGR